MKVFNKDRLPELTKIMYVIQQKGIDRNCEETLRIHFRELEKLLQKTQVFTIWKNKLANKYGVAKELIPEIFMDAYISILFASMGLYKQANICLRAQLETALRLVYFSTHPVEFKWWYEGSEWYLDAKSKDVWGIEYKYFRQLEEVNSFEKVSDFGLFNNIKSFYKVLSKYVHGGAASFQTRPDRISPKYIRKEFNKWVGNFKKVQIYVNTILILGFAELFIAFGTDTQKKMLKIIENDKCKRGLRQSLKLKFRGRI